MLNVDTNENETIVDTTDADESMMTFGQNLAVVTAGVVTGLAVGAAALVTIEKISNLLERRRAKKNQLEK